jgi:IclR family transcriptional regulator, KDG regulon repressor
LIDKYKVSTIQKGIDILNLFKRNHKLTFTEIQKNLNYNKSTLFRFLYTLEQNKYLARDKHGRYELGLDIYILGNQISKVSKLEKASDSSLKKLAETTHLTAHLGILDGLDVIIIGKYNPPNSSISMVSRIGSSVPAHCTGQGKALLAFSSHEKVQNVIDSHGLRRYTSNTLATSNELFQELQKIRERGYAVDNAEHEKHIHCIAFPILNESGELIAAISITGLEMNFVEKEARERYINLLQNTRDTIRKKMNYIT